VGPYLVILFRCYPNPYQLVEHVETAAEALAVALNETGAIHGPRMEQVTGRSARELQQELGGLVYRNPEGAWETADSYLSGDVRAKLATARAAAVLDPAYQRNVAGLEAVQPPDLQPGEIEARLGSSWLPASDSRDFRGRVTRRQCEQRAGRLCRSDRYLDGRGRERPARERQQHHHVWDSAVLGFRPDRADAQRADAHRL